jgi:hypothetical protein
MLEANGRDVRQFFGGASGPTKSGLRVHLSWPLAVLSIGSEQLSLSGRGPLRRMFREMVANPNLVSAQGVHGVLMNGIVITVSKEEPWLFLTPKQKEALAQLRQHGADVAESERRIKSKDYMGY